MKKTISDVEIIYYPHKAHTFLKHNELIDWIKNSDIESDQELDISYDTLSGALEISVYDENKKGAGYEEEETLEDMLKKEASLFENIDDDEDFGARPY